MSIALTIPLEPRGEGRPRAVRRGNRAGIAPHKASAEWRDAAVASVRESLPDGWEPLDGPLACVVVAVHTRPSNLCRKADPDGWIPRPRKPDCDNIAKAVLDACSDAGVWVDDARIWSLTVLDVDGEKGGPGRVHVWAGGLSRFAPEPRRHAMHASDPGDVRAEWDDQTKTMEASRGRA